MTAPRISTVDLDWLAFRYVVGELQGTELAEFEQLLATDDRACTAVVGAVMLVEGVVQVEQRQFEHSTAVAQPLSHRPVRRLAAAMACCIAGLVLAVGWLSFTETSSKRQTSEAATTVAALWVQGVDEDVGESVVSVNSDAADPEDPEDEDAVPGWLLAAVTEQQANDGEETKPN